MSDPTLVVDLDWLRYAAGFTGEKRVIEVEHKLTKQKMQFKNRTEFYGRGKAKDKGWIGEENKSLEVKLTVDDFDIFDIQVPEPIENALFTAKRMMEKVQDALKSNKIEAYYGVGDCFRVERSTVLKYKGNREATLRPMLLPEITEYVVKKYKATPCTYLEADDWCIIAGQKANTIVVSPDKDSGGFPIDWYNPMYPDWGVRDCRGFGEIWIEGEGALEKYRGVGRKFFYWQVAYGDDVDNYKANAACDIPWGKKSAFNAINEARNDREAFAILVEIFQKLYPEPVTVLGWRGEPLIVDWKYMLKEQFDMARMYRHEDDRVDVYDVLRKYGFVV